MEFHRFGAESDPPLLFVLGWGNRPTHETVRWLIDHLTDDYYVHTATLPIHVTNVQREWVRPLEGYAERFDSLPVLAHSAGGLTAAHADLPAETRTYLSPWWGYPPATDNALVDAVAHLPTNLRFLPSGLSSTDLLGEFATDQQLADAAEWVSPRFLRATKRAHDSLPPIDDDAVVFVSLSDRVVSTRAIGDRIPSDRLVVYDGGHELFSSRSREGHLDTLGAVIEDGPDVLG